MVVFVSDVMNYAGNATGPITRPLHRTPPTVDVAGPFFELQRQWRQALKLTAPVK